MGSWWSRQLEDLIVAPGLERDLKRGRQYAVEGRVRDLHVSPGRISALMEGTRPEPYRVQLDLVVFTEPQWSLVVSDILAVTGHWSAICGGRLPDRARSWGLVPTNPIELGLRCSCPVRDLFCKHIAATVFALASHSATHPLLLLHWRGKSRHALAAELQMAPRQCVA